MVSPLMPVAPNEQCGIVLHPEVSVLLMSSEPVRPRKRDQLTDRRENIPEDIPYPVPVRAEIHMVLLFVLLLYMLHVCDNCNEFGICGGVVAAFPETPS